MIGALVAALALAQAPGEVREFDGAQLLGRVCDDVDGDGLCGSEEPGLGGVRVLLENGLEALTDAEGRFHFAALSSRSAETFGNGRLAPGRHRVKVDQTSLAGVWAGVEKGQTVELSSGAALVVFIPLHRTRAADPSPEPSSAFRKVGAALEYELAVTPGDGERVSIEGVEQPTARAWVNLGEGGRDAEVPVSLSRGGTTRFYLQPFHVIRRRGSVLVVPEPLRHVADVSVLASGEFEVEWFEPAASLAVSKDAPLPRAGARSHGRFSGDAVEITFTTPERTWREQLHRPDFALSAVGLLDLEANYDFAKGGFGVFGRGAAAARASFFGFKLDGELDLRDSDFATFTAASLLQPHRIDVFARQLDLTRSPLSWADESSTLATNPSEGRFRVELSREGLGRAGYGSTRWFQASADAGRAHRALQGAFLELRSPDEAPFGVEARGVIAPPARDMFTGLVRRPMHERFESTGGSLFFLARSPVVTGSEAVRIEWRDAVTQLPVGEVHLQRLRDYTVDAASGRVLLNQPMGFYAAEGVLQSDPLTAGAVATLFVDYEYLDVSGGGLTFGGELAGRLGPVRLTGSGFRDGAWTLFRGGAEAKLGPVRLTAEVAHSVGAVEGLAFSREGGLDARDPVTPAATEGWAVTVRARTKGLFDRGWWDAAWRWRQSGFQDAAQLGFLNQLSLRGEQPLGPVVVSALVDVRDMPDPRDPFSGARVRGQLFGGGVGYEAERWGVRLEAREYRQDLPEESREGFTVGLAGRVRLTDWLQLRAGYRQQIVQLGGMDLTFASLGVDLKPTPTMMLGVRGGWGPALGPQVWGTASYSRGDETWYGVQSTDVDAPGTGERRWAVGVRQQLDPTTAVFAEDVSATDVNGLRLGRAVGLMTKVGDALTLSARYEHGARALDGLAPDVTRNAGGFNASYEGETLRAFARAEVRDDTGARTLRQFVVSGGGEWRPVNDVSVTARALWIHSTRQDVLVSRSVDATLSAAWRFAFGAVLARYTWTQSWVPTLERRLHVISLLPTLRIGDRFAIGAGGHLGFSEIGPIVSGSVRPSVRVWQGLELAGEAAARSVIIDPSSWGALRAEVGWRFDHRFFVGAGFNALGFSGTGLDLGATTQRDRVYLRAEVAW
ncbi:MAG: hypothetical protein U0228_32655 [Myxococcaceae bacterium]